MPTPRKAASHHEEEKAAPPEGKLTTSSAAEKAATLEELANAPHYLHSKVGPYGYAKSVAQAKMP